MPNLYSTDELQYLLSSYGKVPTSKIARRLGRTQNAIINTAYRYGIQIKRSVMSWSQIEQMLGVTPDAIKLRIMNAKSDDMIPHRRSGRFYLFYEDEISAWLNRGHILTFDRAGLDSTLHQMYDRHRKNYYTYKELLAIDLALIVRDRDVVKPCINAGRNCSYYYRADVWGLWWNRGHCIPKTSHAYAEAMRNAWNSTYIRKKDLATFLHYTSVQLLAKKLPGTTWHAVRKDSLYRYYTERGEHHMARHFAEKPIYYMELINELEGRNR